jgi:hydrogenase-4 component E
MMEFLIVAFAATLIYLSAAHRFRVFARFMGAQGVLIFGIALLELNEMATANLVLVVAETLLFKGIIVPFMLFYIIRRTQVFKVHAQATPSFYILILNAAALIVSVVIAYTLQNPYINTVFMTVALYALLSGLIIIVTHKLIISHLIGFLIIENAVFLFTIALGNEMPALINIAMLLDIFVGVLIMGFFGMRLKPDTGDLTQLKD